MLANRWIVLFVCLYAFISYAFALQIIPPLIPTIIETFNLTNAQAGLLMSAAVIPGILLALPAGLLTDRYGIKPIGIISSTLLVIGCTTTALTNSFAGIITGRIILGAGGTLIATTIPSTIAQWFPPKELGKAMGIYSIGMPLALAAAFTTASTLSTSPNWEYTFYISIILVVLNIIAYILAVKEGPLKSTSKTKPDLKKALKNTETWKAGIIWLFFNAAILSFTTWAPKIFQESYQMPPFTASLIASTIMIVQIPLTPLYGFASDKLGRRKPFILIGSMLTTVLFAATIFSPAAWITVLVICLGIAAALIPPIVNSIPPEALGADLAGSGFGIMTICLNISVTVAPPLIGLLLDLSSTPILVFAGISLFSLAATIMSYSLKSG